MAMMDEIMNEIAQRRASMGGELNAADNTLFVTSLKEASFLFQQNMMPSGARFRKVLADYITEPANHVCGTQDQYHNLIMDFFRVGDFYTAIQVCEYALQTYPFNCNLMADIIKACGDSGQFEQGDLCLERAEKLSKDAWNWRLFLYAVDYLQSKLKAQPDDEELYQKASALAQEYIGRFPYDEHGYNQKAELLIMTNRREEAMEKLHEYIFGTQLDPNDRSSQLVTAQCCTTYLELLDGTGHYEERLRTARQGILYSKTEQISASIGNFLYQEALALDGKEAANGYENADKIKTALSRYQLAYDVCREYSPHHVSEIEQHYSCLRSQIPEKKDDPGPLIKRPLSVELSDLVNLEG